MLRIYVGKYLELGEEIQDARTVFHFMEVAAPGDPDKTLKPREKEALRQSLMRIFDECAALELPTAADIISNHIQEPDLPKTAGELDLLIEVVQSELKGKLFLFVPPHRAKFYESDKLVSPAVKTAFPSACRELGEAGNCFAAARYTAAVFHAMRAAEIGIRVLAKELGVTFSYSLELAEWGKIAGELEPRINELKCGPRGDQKDADLKFFSEAAAQFRHFNNGWRVRVSHAREFYHEQQAATLLGHTIEFFETLSQRLTE